MRQHGRHRDGASGVIGGKALAEVRVTQGRAEKFPRVLAPGANAAEQALDEHAGERGAERSAEQVDDDVLAPNQIRLQLPDNRRRHDRGNRLAVLRQPARFALYVSFEIQLKRGWQPQALEDHQNRARPRQPVEQHQVHLAAATVKAIRRQLKVRAPSFDVRCSLLDVRGSYSQVRTSNTEHRTSNIEFLLLPIALLGSVRSCPPAALSA